MKKIRVVLIISLLSMYIFSCTSEKERKIKKINENAIKILKSSLLEAMTFNINEDDIIKEFHKIPSDSAELKMKFANNFKERIDKLQLKRYDQMKLAEDSIIKVKTIEVHKWNKSKAGRIFFSHNDWTKSECDRLANKEIWIGMSLDMLKYLRGKPDAVNKSNYGRGIRYQWCWHNLTPSYFYGGEDLIITSYN
jgi:hypothetical protein